jgi:SAM-dependent methyltransferase
MEARDGLGVVLGDEAAQNRRMSVAALKTAVPHRYRQAGRNAFLRMAALTNAGSAVECPCCERHFRKFARFYGEHVQCPGCGSLMRHRALQLLLRDELRVTGAVRDFLHVAPNSSGMRRIMEAVPLGSYVTLDIDSPLADVHADVTELPFADDSFDLVVCLHVLEHVPDDRKAIREFYRVLRPGGRAVLQVPPSALPVTFEDPSIDTPAERERVFGQFDHVRICGSDYGERMEEAGFEVTFDDYVKRVPEPLRKRYGLYTGEPFHVCVKPALH